MVATYFVLCALAASTALAAPQNSYETYLRKHHARHHRHHGTGWGTGTGYNPYPTGGLNSTRNGTQPWSSVPVITVTVEPLPATTTVDVATTVVANNAVAATDAVAATAVGDSTCASPTTVTEVATSINYVTVTYSPSSNVESSTSSTTATTTLAVVTSTSVSTAPLSTTTPATTPNSVNAATGSSSTAAFSGAAFYSNGGSKQHATTLATSVSSQPAKTTQAPPSSAAAAAPAATTTAAAAAVGNTGVTSNGGLKKGLAYNSASLLSLFGSSGAGWAYNWGAGANGNLPSGIEFVPMLWGATSVNDWAGAVKKAMAGGSRAALSFNEPDHAGQANMDVATAVKLHKQCMDPLKGQLQIGSPAVTNSGSKGQGLDWMQSFLGQCAGSCNLDFLAIHWYANSFENFKDHVTKAIAMAKTSTTSGQVWITEFANQGSAADNAAFIAQALPWLESNPGVGKYAYFMVGDGQLLSNNALNALGKAYVA